MLKLSRIVVMVGIPWFVGSEYSGKFILFSTSGKTKLKGFSAIALGLEGGFF